MNLVKAQEYAASLPLAELKKYADGLNPSMIPPWLATGEMEAKTKRMEMANNLAAAAQGQKPSIKEQVEQKAGLMALQQAQMAQQQGAAAAPQPGGPVPEGTPEPEQQPRQEAGLDQLQSNIQMAGGGIVAFSGKDESLVDRYGDAPKAAAAIGVPVWAYKQAADFLARTGTNATVAEVAKALVREGAKATAQGAANLAKTAATGPGMAVMAGGIPATQFATDVMANNPKLREAYADNYMLGAMDPDGGLASAILSQGAKTEAKKAPTPVAAAAADAETEKLKRLAAARANTGISQNQQLVPGASKPPAATNLNAQAPKPPAAPAAPAPDSLESLYRQTLTNGPKERTVDEQLAEQLAIRKGAGLEEPAGKAQLDRIAALKEQYQATQKTPLQEMIAMLGQSGQYKGLSGLAPAYTSMGEQKRKSDLAMAEKINELMGGVETTQRGEKTQLAKDVTTGREKDLDRTSQFGREKMQSLGQTSSSKYNADMHYRAAMAQMSNANARQDAQEKRLLLDSFKTRIASIDRELAPLLKTPYGPAKDQIAQLQAEKAGLTKALDETSGISKIAGAPSAASPSGTSLKYNPKTGKIE